MDRIHEDFYALHLRGEGQFDEAIEIYRKWLQADPLDYSARFNLSVALFHRGDQFAGLQEIRRVVQAAPDNFAFRTVLINLLLQKGDWSEAVVEALEMVRLRPAAHSHGLAGEAYAGLGEFTSAIRCFETATSLPNATHNLYFSLGDVYEKTGRLTDGIAAYRESLKRAPRFLEGLLRLGKALATAGDVGEAREQWETVLQLIAAQNRGGPPSSAIAEFARRAADYLEQYREGIEGFSNQ